MQIQILLSNNTWNTCYTRPKIDQSSKSPTDWTSFTLSFNVKNFGVKLNYDQIDTPHADMCFSNITATHSVY